MSTTYSNVAIQTDEKPFDNYPSMQEHFLFSTKEQKVNSLSSVSTSGVEVALSPSVYVQEDILVERYCSSTSASQEDEVPQAVEYVDLQPSEFVDLSPHLQTFVRKDPTHLSMDDDLYICRYCSKRFTNKCSLSHHYRKIHPDQPTIKITKNGKEKIATLRNVCDVCNAKFASSTLLNYHYRIHTNERTHKCKVCGKTFRMALNLKIHERIHTNERPYACPECDKTFKSQPALYRHKLVHTGEKPYACTICGKSFTQSNSVKLHVRTVHLKQPAPYKKKVKPCRCQMEDQDAATETKEPNPVQEFSEADKQGKILITTSVRSHHGVVSNVSVSTSSTERDPISVKIENPKFITVELPPEVKPVIQCLDGSHVGIINESVISGGSNALQNL